MQRVVHALSVSMLLTVVLALAADALGADDGRRAVTVKRYGIAVRIPQAWRLIDWGQNDQAFTLKLPQDMGSKTGFVGCRLSAAPDNLEEYRKVLESNENATTEDGSKRSLVENKIEPIDVARFGQALADQLEERLITTWDLQGPAGEHSFEVATRVVHDGMLYTFTLASDEAHYDAYRLDFEDMLTSATFTPPEIGVRKMPGGYWMQSEFRFAMQLPATWKPAFGPNDKVLFFATGSTHALFTDNLLVLASPLRPLDLEQLRASMPEQIVKSDPKADVVCRLVPQQGTTAVETVVHTVRGTTRIAILERRFSSGTRNYEVKFTCEEAAFDKLLPELRKSLDSFVEVLDQPPRSEA